MRACIGVAFQRSTGCIKVTASPAAAQAPSSGITPTLKRNSATAAATRDQRRDRVEAPAEALRPQHVVGEEQRQVEDHADHRRGDRRQRRGEAELAVRGLDQRPAGEDEDERRQEGEEGDHRWRPARAPRNSASGPEHLLQPAADEADEGHHHDQRAGRRLAQRQAVDHLRGRSATGAARPRPGRRRAAPRRRRRRSAARPW